MARKKKHFNTRDTYSEYLESSKNPVEVSTYCKVLDLFFKFYMNKLFEIGELIIPERLGKIEIIGKKANIQFNEDGSMKGLAPDWVRTKLLWEENPEAKEKKQLVYHFNENTGGCRYKVYWNKSRVLFTNKTLFRLKLSRANKRALSQLIKDGKEYKIK